MQTLSRQPACLPAETSERIEQFRTLYRTRFGVESKPEYEALITQLPLTPEQALQLLDDLTQVVHHVFDAYFAQRSIRLVPERPSDPVENAS